MRGGADLGATPAWFPSARQRERDAYRRGQARRSLLIAATSTVVLVAALVYAAASSPGWARVQAEFFDPAAARQSLPDLWQGLLVNLRIFAFSAVGMLALGLLLAVLRTLRGPVFWPLRAFAVGYVDLFRGMPLILVLYLVGFGIPGLRYQGLPRDKVVYGVIALVLTYAAYVAEVFRAGIESVHPSQRAAARSLGLTSGQTLRHVVLPQATRRVIPPLLNDVVSLTKDSGLVSVLGIIDIVKQAAISTSDTASHTPYVVAGIMFVVLTVPMTRLTDYVSRRYGYTNVPGHL